MTAQIDDVFLYRGDEYAVAGISEGKLFDPAVLEIEPSMASTACWRGYQVVYSIVDRHLVAANLHVNLLEKKGGRFQRQLGPTINGVAPEGPDEDESGPDEVVIQFFNNHYEGMNYHLEYSGGLLLADGFIRELYVHMGFHPAWKYETVIELVFENGILTDETDRSLQMAEIRDMVAESSDGNARSMPSDDEIRRFVDRAFDRTYRM